MSRQLMDEREREIREAVQTDEERGLADSIVPTSVMRYLLSLLDEARKRTILHSDLELDDEG